MNVPPPSTRQALPLGGVMNVNVDEHELRELRAKARGITGLPTAQELARMMAKRMLVQRDAIDDPEGYDYYATMGRIGFLRDDLERWMDGRRHVDDA